MKLKINKATVSFLLATALFTPVISGITNSFFGIIKTETAFAENGALSYINYDENEIQVTEDYSALVGAATATSAPATSRAMSGSSPRRPAHWPAPYRSG